MFKNEKELLQKINFFLKNENLKKKIINQNFIDFKKKQNIEIIFRKIFKIV